jgi:hypothetical protein
MVFTIAQSQRDDLIGRMDDHLAAIGFHCNGQVRQNIP